MNAEQEYVDLSSGFLVGNSIEISNLIARDILDSFKKRYSELSQICEDLDIQYV